MTRARDLAAFVSNADGDIKFDTDTLFIDSSANRVGIGTTSPTAQLTSYQSLNGDPKLGHFYNDDSGAAAESVVYVTNSSTVSDGLFLQTYGASATTAGGFVQDASIVGSGTGASGGLSIMTRANADMRFYTNGHTNERMRILAGGGLTFNGDTAAANALDDYEEGTWTPTVGNATTNPSVTYSVRTGSYTKIGNMVHAFFDVTWTALSGQSGQCQLQSFPFTAASGGNMAGYSAPVYRSMSGLTASTNATDKLAGYIQGTAWYFEIDNQGSAGYATRTTASAWNSAGRVTGYFAYKTNS